MPALSAVQLADRIRGVGASEAAMALGLSPFGGPGALQARKLGAPETDGPSWAMQLGTIFEAAIADAARQREGWSVRGWHRSVWHPAGIPMFATPDYSIVGLGAGLEIKKSEQGEQWGDDGDPAGVPVHVVVQVQAQMACIPSWSRVWVAVLLYGRDLRLYPVDRNPVQIAYMEQALADWWQRHIVERVPVEPDGSEGSAAAIRALYPRPTEEPRVATPEEELLALEVIEAAALKAEAEQRHELARQRLSAAIGPAAAVVGTTWKATLALQRGRVDWKSAAMAAGVTEEAAEGFRGEASRVLRVSTTAKEKAA